MCRYEQNEVTVDIYDGNEQTVHPPRLATISETVINEPVMVGGNDSLAPVYRRPVSAIAPPSLLRRKHVA